MSPFVETALLIAATILVGLLGALISDARDTHRSPPLTKSLLDLTGISTLFLIPICLAWMIDQNISSILALHRSSGNDGFVGGQMVLYSFWWKFLFLLLISGYRKLKGTK